MVAARDIDLNRAVNGLGIMRRGDVFVPALVNNLNRKETRRFNSPSLNVFGIRRKLGIKLAFIAYRRATCATETPGAHVCAQMDTFSSSDQNRFF